jgi:hypothetical protein
VDYSKFELQDEILMDNEDADLKINVLLNSTSFSRNYCYNEELN